MANIFNDFCVSIARTLHDGCNSDGDFTFFLKRADTTFEFKAVLIEDVKRVLTNIPENKATGLDDIPAKMIKMAMSYIVSPLTHLINFSLTSGVIPKEWKTAVVIPIFKSEDVFELSNYRPISILLILSKAIERIVHEQVTEYLTQNVVVVQSPIWISPKVFIRNSFSPLEPY